MDSLIEVKDLKTTFHTLAGRVPAVDGVSLTIKPGETLGVVGESGCGKSVTALSIMRLIPKPPGQIESGEIRFQGQNLLTMNTAQMRSIRGKQISMIFQEPMTSLNPVYTVGYQIAEALQIHEKLGTRASWSRAVEMLKLVGIPLPERRAHEYPHQLSGGMRQRVMIGMALSCNPKLLIADEPTTALDVTIQAQILELMKQLKRDFHTAIMLITHDLGVIAEMAERVAVMYAGKVVEEAPVRPLFRSPLHPYTRGLLLSIPHLHRETATRLHVIKGTVPNLLWLPQGCRFNPRCPLADARCREEEPTLQQVADGRWVSCWLPLTDQKEVSAS